MKSRFMIMMLAAGFVGLGVQNFSAIAQEKSADKSDVKVAAKDTKYPVHALEAYKKSLLVNNSSAVLKNWDYKKADAELAELYVKKQHAIFKFFTKLEKKFGKDWQSKVKTPLLRDLVLSRTLAGDIRNSFSIPELKNIAIANTLNNKCSFFMKKVGNEWKISARFDKLKKADKEKYADWLVKNIVAIKKASKRIFKSKDLTAQQAIEKFQSAYTNATVDAKTKKATYPDMLGYVTADQSSPKKQCNLLSI